MWRKFPEIFFAGQIIGVEGYTESASMGLYAAYQVTRRLQGLDHAAFPVDTAVGALVNYAMTMPRPSPSSFNFGLLPQIVLTPEQTENQRQETSEKGLSRGEGPKKL